MVVNLHSETVLYFWIEGENKQAGTKSFEDGGGHFLLHVPVPLLPITEGWATLPGALGYPRLALTRREQTPGPRD